MKDKDTQQPMNALHPLPKDERDFSHAQVFGSIAQSDLPIQDFIVSQPLEIKDQDINYVSDFCTSYSASEVAEDEDDQIFVPEYTFSKAMELLAEKSGPEVLNQYGMNLRDICNAAIKKGFLPRVYDPFKCNSLSRPPRNFLADWKNWPDRLDSLASSFKKEAYYSAIAGPYDFFDNLRSTMWKNIARRQSIIAGALWRSSWQTTDGGIISTTYEAGGSGHAFKICGQKTIDGEIHLVIQNSYGIKVGDNGFYYFPREVVNKEFAPYGAFIFKDLPKIKIPGIFIPKVGFWKSIISFLKSII